MPSMSSLPSTFKCLCLFIQLSWLLPPRKRWTGFLYVETYSGAPAANLLDFWPPVTLSCTSSASPSLLSPSPASKYMELSLNLTKPPLSLALRAEPKLPGIR